MFDPRPDFGRPDRGILSALRGEPALAPGTLGADVQAHGVEIEPAELLERLAREWTDLTARGLFAPPPASDA